MKTTYNPRTDTYTVTVTTDDLMQAFYSCSNLEKFLHEIAKETIGESFADEYFPFWEE